MPTTIVSVFRGKLPRALARLACGALAIGPLALRAGEPALAGAPGDGSDPWALHGQVTNVTQGHPPFHAPYSGDNSLRPDGRTEETTDATLYAGARLWRGTELWINPEIDQGFGLSNTLGVAGFPSGEAYKVGQNTPYLRLPRFFLRHVIALGGASEKVEGVANQLAGSRPTDNITLTLGKFSAVDVFDLNAYAHDPRADFFNWSIVESGAFDYAADPWGYTYGMAAEWSQDRWTVRGGLFQLSPAPNSKIVAPDLRKFMFVAEAESRFEWRGRPGKLRVLGFVDHAPLARYRDAVDLARASGGTPDVDLVRRVANKAGGALNAEQEIADGVGAFARVSFNDGAFEAYDFTEINRSIAGGLSIEGRRWGRERDTLGIAAAVNALSHDARDYFAAGGMGILIGDGALAYRAERIFETYYAVRFARGLTVSLDYQRVSDPAHNADRGPVNIYALRVHAEF